MNSVENSKSLSVSTTCRGTGLFEGSQVTNHFTCAAATPAKGIDTITWHAMKATSEAALGRARMTLTALFRSFAHANDNETASTRLRTGPSTGPSTGASTGAEHRQAMAKETRPKIAA